MTMSDPIADLLTRLRNSLARQKAEVSMPASKVKVSLVEVLKQEGYVEDYEVSGEQNGKRTLTIKLKYYEGKPVITSIDRASRPGLRQYRGAKEIPAVKRGLGITVVSTPKGVMTDRAARRAGVGGELLCYVA
ncbi:MAG: 30S ribosomal protein S8 [Immundisolibacteraceae bacterium]|jgi:small subunit ribosomal protein S8|nr:30S ribosomal protein S8 [Immundisolibacteraceae bacterium]